MTTDTHERWIRRCLELARRGAGHVSPNPMVGAVLVGVHDIELAEGWHEAYGEAHAEQAVLREVRRQGIVGLDQATLYVNLEPCAHHGKTPPCADEILKAGIGRVVVGTRDPFPSVDGRGIEMLRAGGVDVTVGVCEEECKRLNEAFFHHVRTSRPLVTLKVAQTLDGCVATATGDARWVSGKAARTRVHRWRAELDAVLVGSGTARADDPALTVRHVEGRQPARVVLDRMGALPPNLNLFTDDNAEKTVAIVGMQADRPAYADALEAAGGRLLRVAERDDHLDLEALLETLGTEGDFGGRPLQSLLVEAGPGLATALLRQELVDRFYCFIAPKLLGRGTPTLRSLGIEKMGEATAFAEYHWEEVGDDMLFQGYRHAV